MMYRIMCRYVGSDKFEDTFCDIDNLKDAELIAERWKRGAFCHDADSIVEAVVMDSSGNVVYTATGHEKQEG